MIVDDEQSVRNSLRLGLEPCHYEIQEASSGKEAVERATIFAPDLIILDLCLGDTDGLQVLKDIRKWSNASILILTVRDAESDKVQLLDAGADDYLTKPFSLSELMARLRVLERRTYAGEINQPIVKYNGFEINFVAQTVQIDCREIKITSTEFQLLRILVQAAGKVISAKALLAQVWGDAGLENPHYIRIYIGSLRKKIEKNPSLPTFIITEMSVGYRFNMGRLP
ncbi:MAG: response regulator [Moraxellaceae bacterium]|nr:response regulator [Pseudobdellovibrionaceae bacterium]